MDKTLQDLAWSCLPKEFKEEVKKEYRKGYVCETLTMLITLFGHHNLTSDAEEEGMLTVSRKRVQDEFNSVKIIASEKICSKVLAGAADMYLKTLERLFGSKCLPDNVESSEPNVESSEPNVDSLPQNPTENCDNESHISADCNKPAEPKFKVGDIAVVRGFNHPLLKQDGAIVTILSYHDKGDFYSCAIAPNVGIDVDAKYLEPYTEPTNFGREVNFPTKNNLAIYLKKSKNCDNRLQIAAMAMQGIIAHGELVDPDEVTDMAIIYTDELIEKAEKGGSDGN